MSQKQKEYNKRYRQTEKGKEANRAGMRKWYAKNKDKFREYIRKYSKTEKGRAAQKKANKKWREKNNEAYRKSHSLAMRKMKYGITPMGLDQMICNQLGSCAICNAPFLNGDFDVDHCHKSMKVRGLLCRACNTVLGRFADSIPRFYAAIEYLRASS